MEPGACGDHLTKWDGEGQALGVAWHPACPVPTASCVSLRPVGRKWQAPWRWRSLEEDVASQSTTLPTRCLTAEPPAANGPPLWWLLPAHLVSPAWVPLPRAFLSALGSPPLGFWPDVCLSVLTLVPTGPKGAFRLPCTRPQSGGHPPHPARLQAPDWAAGGHPSGTWRPALSPVRASSFCRNPCTPGWGAGENRRGEGRVCPVRKGPDLPKAGLSWEWSLQGPPWRWQSDRKEVS